jgi:hypothetical protein
MIVLGGNQNSESTYTLAVQKQYFQTGQWFCFFTFCHYQTFFEDNTLWVNMNSWLGDEVKNTFYSSGVGGFFAGVVTEYLVSGSTNNNLFKLFKNLGTKIVSASGITAISALA